MATQKIDLNNPGANPFLPHLATLKWTLDLTYDTRLFNVELNDPEARKSFVYKPGQFIFASAFGIGEAPFGLTSVSYRGEPGIEFAIRRVGTVTNGLHELEPGATLGIRGPMGNFFPMDSYKSKNMFIIGGGIGMAPMRPVVTTVIDHRNDYGKLTIVNGARSPQDLVFQNEFDIWAKSPNTELVLTVDRADDKWKGRVALVPDVVTSLAPSPKDTIAVICGPPIMIRFTLERLKKLGFENHQVFTTLENKMKCGLGKCARCNVGDKYVCKDGPVFTFEQISHFLEEVG